MITNLLKNCQKQFVQKAITFILAFAMVATVFAPTHLQAATQKVKVYYNGSKKVTSYKAVNYTYQGKKVDLGKSPIIAANGYNMAPYTMVFVKNGPKAKHSLTEKTGILILKYNGVTLKLQNKSKTAYVNGKKITLSTAPVYVKYSTTGKKFFMVPMNKVCQLLGLEYAYNSTTNTAKVTLPKKEVASTTKPVKPVTTNTTNTTATTTTTTADTKKPATTTPAVQTKTQATSFKAMSTSQYIQYMGPIAKADYKKTGVLASVTLAQSILESGWGKSELAQKANNMFGMKTSLSGNAWGGSAWDGTSQYVKRTGEEFNGKKTTITAAFRAYPSVEKSVADHSAYLLGAKAGSALRYAGLTKTTSYKTQIQIIKDGGYATSSDYVSAVCKVIETYKLNQWDK